MTRRFSDRQGLFGGKFWEVEDGNKIHERDGLLDGRSTEDADGKNWRNGLDSWGEHTGKLMTAIKLMKRLGPMRCLSTTSFMDHTNLDISSQKRKALCVLGIRQNQHTRSLSLWQ